MTITSPSKTKRARRFARTPKADTDSARNAAPPDTESSSTLTTSPPPIAGSKISYVLALLQRPEGATLDEIIEVTGWLPHTTRAAFTGLRKKGHTILRGKRDNATFYSIESAA